MKRIIMMRGLSGKLDVDSLLMLLTCGNFGLKLPLK
jgi:hypothetical protein